MGCKISYFNLKYQKIIVKILELYLLYFFEKYLKDFQNTFTISFHKIYKNHEIKI
jgi:hypothetical protein